MRKLISDGARALARFSVVARQGQECFEVLLAANVEAVRHRGTTLLNRVFPVCVIHKILQQLQSDFLALFRVKLSGEDIVAPD